MTDGQPERGAMKDVDLSRLVRLIVGVLTPAAVFYVIGFVVTQAYVIETKLQASFWFTESFYREAGARFLLDVLLSIALLPHLFIVLSALFILCFPSVTHVAWRQAPSAPSGLLAIARNVLRKDVTFIVTLLIVLGGVVFILRDCGTAACSRVLEIPDWLFSSRWLAAERILLSDERPLLGPMALFLALAVPSVVVLGLLSYRLLAVRGEAGAGQGAAQKTDRRRPMPAKSRLLAGFLLLSSFVVMAAYIPIAYGAYFYDFTVVSLVDSGKCANRQLFVPTQCFLLGRFDTRYILIGREVELGSMDETPQRIYIKQVDNLEPFSIESRNGVPLRSLAQIREY
jgi:hypothetical protein